MNNEEQLTDLEFRQLLMEFQRLRHDLVSRAVELKTEIGEINRALGNDSEEWWEGSNGI